MDRISTALKQLMPQLGASVLRSAPHLVLPTFHLRAQEPRVRDLVQGCSMQRSHRRRQCISKGEHFESCLEPWIGFRAMGPHPSGD